MWYNSSVPNDATVFEGPWPFFQASLLALLGCAFPLRPRTLLFRDNDCNQTPPAPNQTPTEHNNHRSRSMRVLVPQFLSGI